MPRKYEVGTEVTGESLIPEEVLALDLTKPHSVHSEDHKVSTYDQNGTIYDSITQQPLDVSSDEKVAKLKEKYALVDYVGKGGGVIHSKVKTPEEKVNDAINTMRATGALDPDIMSRFESLLRNTFAEGKKSAE